MIGRWLAIGVFLSSLLWVQSEEAVPSRANSLRGLSTTRRTTTRRSELTCQVLAVDTDFVFLHEDDEVVVDYSCIPLGDDGEPTGGIYDLILPDEFVEEHEQSLEEGNVEIAIEGGSIVGDAVLIPEGARITMLGAVFGGPEFRVSNHQTRSVLVARVTTTDSSPSVTPVKLATTIFNDDAPSLRSQFLKCSFGKMEFVPAADNSTLGIEGGVIDVELDFSTEGRTRKNLTNEVTRALRDRLGVRGLARVYDHVMICLPPGTGFWLAFSFTNYHISVYNDVWCSYLSTNIHEIGHNLGLKHSNENGNYQDQTGYMGFSYFAETWPSMCFNGLKHWNLGWFSDRTATVNPFQGPWRGKVAAFVDYNLTASDENVIVNVGDLYIQYNRATKFNYQTREKKNEITIVQDKTGGSEMLGGLADETANFTYANFTGSNQTLVVRVCYVVNSDDNDDVDYMELVIGMEDEAFCPSLSPSAGPTESPAPSPSPSRFPTITPGPTKSFLPSTSIAPTASPAPSPSPSRFPTVTAMPSFTPLQPISFAMFESSGPSAKPSWIAPDRGAACDDSTEPIFMINKYESCSWLAAQPAVAITSFCRIAHILLNCRETCGHCSDDCEDNDANFIVDDEVVTCAWVQQQTPQNQEVLCQPRQPAYQHCGETCNSCLSSIDGHENCEDAPKDERFFVNDEVGSHPCIWLADENRRSFRDELCVPEHPAFHICPETCGKCIDHCWDDPNAIFQYHDGLRDCQWLSIRDWEHEEACRIEHIRGVCLETCKAC